MAYYKICLNCGGNLDPGEKCDCEKEKARQQELFSRHLKVEPRGGQLAFAFGCEDISRERMQDRECKKTITGRGWENG